MKLYDEMDNMPAPVGIEQAGNPERIPVDVARDPDEYDIL